MVIRWCPYPSQKLPFVHHPALGKQNGCKTAAVR
ncbi:hypothetical protein IL54_2012 [Sphingobium sp. ba1]|nr:hypothetical protein IL54_2012 [Sphingobium sp. ba1]